MPYVGHEFITLGTGDKKTRAAIRCPSATNTLTDLCRFCFPLRYLPFPLGFGNLLPVGRTYGAAREEAERLRRMPGADCLGLFADWCNVWLTGSGVTGAALKRVEFEVV
jgi:hypothetical protein